MPTRGIHDRDGELFCFVEGTRLYNLDGERIGELVGRTVMDTDGKRRWVIDGDALLDLRGNVIGYLGQPVREDR